VRRVRYCTRCILPDTRPGLTLGEDGVCSACAADQRKQDQIDWDERRRAFRELADDARRRSHGYDCVIPVSGGKDSTWQVLKCLEYGLNPLAVTWKTPTRTAVGARNLANLVSLGVDHIDYQVNPRVEKKFLYQALARYGSTGIPMHMALFNIPLSIAVRFEIPLVVWGENSALEYSGNGAESLSVRMDRGWLARFGVTHGTTARDWISAELTERELTPYFGPDAEEFERRGIQAVFLGCFFPWDPQTTLEAALAAGFEVRPEGPKTGYYNYADIDDDFISIHHYLKWYKFGFTRLFDNLAIEIRHHRMTREEAVEIVRARGDQTPHEDIAKFCAFTGITGAHFFELAERFRNRTIWERRDGVWTIPGFLVPDWRWA
jgi:N-acetyl sugar amidotransferase